MSGFKILALSPDSGTMVIDWGFVTLNHFIPLAVLENPVMPADEVATHIEALRPAAPEAIEIPQTLLDLLAQSKVPATSDSLCKQIDIAADIARATVAADPLRAMEYSLAASEAQAFKTAGYPAQSVPRTVAAWAIEGRTPQQAADNILVEAAQYNEALYLLRETRLQAKAQVRAAMQAGNAELAQDIAAETIASIEAAVAGIGNNA